MAMAAEPQQGPQGLLYSPAGGWQWDNVGGWRWCRDGGWIEIHAHGWWRNAELRGVYIAANNVLVPLSPAMIERQPLLHFLPVHLQARAVFDPVDNLYVADARGGVRSLDELPAWPVRLDAREQDGLDRLLQLEPPVSKAAARKLLGVGTDRFRRIWQQFPVERRLQRGRPSGRRLSATSRLLLGLRKK
jgi:hypothetical protein